MMLRRIAWFAATLAASALGMSCVGDDLHVRAVSAQGPPTTSIDATLVRVVGRRGTGPGEFVRPTGVSLNALGQAFVVDTGNERVQMFDRYGEYVIELGGFGWDDRQFNQPLGVSAAASLDIWVADTQNRRIAHLDSRLHWLGALDEEVSDGEADDLGFPTDVAEGADGWLWFVDRDDDRLRRLSPYPETADAMGERLRYGRLSDPEGLAIAPDGTIIVADTGNDRLVLFDQFGNMMRSWGEGVLSRPSGVHVTTSGDIVIADTGNRRVLLLNRLLHPVGEIAGVEEPRDVATHRADQLWVTDSQAHRVLIYDLSRTVD